MNLEGKALWWRPLWRMRLDGTLYMDVWGEPARILYQIAKQDVSLKPISLQEARLFLDRKTIEAEGLSGPDWLELNNILVLWWVQFLNQNGMRVIVEDGDYIITSIESSKGHDATVVRHLETEGPSIPFATPFDRPPVDFTRRLNEAQVRVVYVTGESEVIERFQDSTHGECYLPQEYWQEKAGKIQRSFALVSLN